MENRVKPIIVEQRFDLPVEKVWKAITDRDQMIQWFFADIPEFKAEKGFTTEFDVESGRRIFRHRWMILEADPPRKIVYHWSYKDLEGEGLVSFELFETNSGTLLRLTNTGLDSFPDDIPEFSRESCIGGWEYFIKGNLRKFVE